MGAIVTVFKNEIKKAPELITSLPEYCSEVKELEEAFVFSPKSGSLFRILNLLKERNIIYGTHFNSTDENEPPSIH
jgi:hypothetical protein